MRISDWSSDVCSSDLRRQCAAHAVDDRPVPDRCRGQRRRGRDGRAGGAAGALSRIAAHLAQISRRLVVGGQSVPPARAAGAAAAGGLGPDRARPQEGVERSEEHTSELQSLMRISYAVFCLKKKKEKSSQSERKK